MSRKRTNEERKAAVESLFRVRAVESELDENGEKSVWHQGSKGADLLSIVNRTGHVVRQEFQLFEDFVSWSKEKGLRTGESLSGPSSAAGKASDEIRFDRDPDNARLGRAMDGLERYSGNDKYLLHVRTLIRMSLSGMDRELSAVTNTGPKKAVEITNASSNATGLWPYIAVGFGAGLAVTGLAWLVLR